MIGTAGEGFVIFSPYTPGSVLQQKYQSEVDRQGIRIRVVEKAGRSIKSMIQRSDPFWIEKCDRQPCMVCQTSEKGSCDKKGVTYSIRCAECTERGIEKVYYGQSSRIAYSREEEYLDEYHRKTKDSVCGDIVYWIMIVKFRILLSR